MSGHVFTTRHSLSSVYSAKICANASFVRKLAKVPPHGLELDLLQRFQQEAVVRVATQRRRDALRVLRGDQHEELVVPPRHEQLLDLGRVAHMVGSAITSSSRTKKGAFLLLLRLRAARSSFKIFFWRRKTGLQDLPGRSACRCTSLARTASKSDSARPSAKSLYRP